MSEFTGERLIPGEVDEDLWNEHISRYAFAASLCGGAETVIDAGCGTGYGTSLMAAAASRVMGFDIAPGAIDYAVSRYGASGVRFQEGTCESIPAETGGADLLIAFEVIEHLAGWREFLGEARRVLAPAGRLLVSTPNRRDYSEARAGAGPNPFHVHEFDYEEFLRELSAVFPHVRILGQNHGHSVVFVGDARLQGNSQFARANSAVPDAAFFLAICSCSPLPPVSNFVYVPEASNVLRERERHIGILKSDLTEKSAAHAALLAAHRETEVELRRSNGWAATLNQRLEERENTIKSLQEQLEVSNNWASSLNARAGELEDRVEQLQLELSVSNEWAANANRETEQRITRILTLQDELDATNRWAAGLDQELAQRVARVVALQQELAEQQAGAQAALDDAQRVIDDKHRVIEERTRWAQHRDAEYEKAVVLYENALALVKQHQERADAIENSRWVQLGRSLRVGPAAP